MVILFLIEYFLCSADVSKMGQDFATDNRYGRLGELPRAHMYKVYTHAAIMSDLHSSGNFKI